MPLAILVSSEMSSLRGLTELIRVFINLKRRKEKNALPILPLAESEDFLFS